MSLAIVHARAALGVEAPRVDIEVHLSGGLPGTNIVGLPEAAVRESRDRVRSALLTANFDWPQRRITINLAPADLPKDWTPDNSECKWRARSAEMVQTRGRFTRA